MKNYFMWGLIILLLLFYINPLGTKEKIDSIINIPKQSGEPDSQTYTTTHTLQIANWNLQIFGKSKSEDLNLMESYASKIRTYDIIFIQEIRDISGESFVQLCNMLQANYDCQISSRAGRTTSKEQYGVIYRKGIVASLIDYNPDISDRWERPPIQVNFRVENITYTIWNIHTKPDDVNSELKYLEDVISQDGNVILMGDLNVDCDYYDPIVQPDFDTWNWVIPDTADTTVSSTNCAYDRIIMDTGAYSHLVNWGIDKQVSTQQSDHYLVWAEVTI